MDSWVNCKPRHCRYTISINIHQYPSLFPFGFLNSGIEYIYIQLGIHDLALSSMWGKAFDCWHHKCQLFMSCKSFDADSYQRMWVKGLDPANQRFRMTRVPCFWCLSHMSAHMNHFHPCPSIFNLWFYAFLTRSQFPCATAEFIWISVQSYCTYTRAKIHGTAACIKCHQQTPHFSEGWSRCFMMLPLIESWN